MNRQARSRQLVWAALCAVWFAALAPSLSAVLAAQNRVTVEVCSASGMRLVSVEAGGQRRTPVSLFGGKHCSYCVLQQDQITPPLYSLTWLDRGDLSDALVAARISSDRPALAWLHQPSRAPPSLMLFA